MITNNDSIRLVIPCETIHGNAPCKFVECYVSPLDIERFACISQQLRDLGAESIRFIDTKSQWHLFDPDEECSFNLSTRRCSHGPAYLVITHDAFGYTCEARSGGWAVMSTLVSISAFQKAGFASNVSSLREAAA